MAIVIEEEKKSGGGLVTFVLWLIILGVVLGAIYFLFFKQPELIEVVAPPNYRNIQTISKININPQLLTNDPTFSGLLNYIQVNPVTSNAGRVNPFISY